MKSLNEYVTENFDKSTNMKPRKYHLSYDLNKEGQIKDSSEARQHVLSTLCSLGVSAVQSPCESTIIFEYKDENFDFEKLNGHLKDNFYFSICLVSFDTIKKEDSELIMSKEDSNSVSEIFTSLKNTKRHEKAKNYAEGNK
ncbi:hypothetical protein [Flavobacterium sp.]|uniref:hypothetical protein n=1 Tax=Flavobacterium sp. TaxID=239 RepID=UPI002624A93F|nr:hypothetical protein [Flavobacterium sp.]